MYLKRQDLLHQHLRQLKINISLLLFHFFVSLGVCISVFLWFSEKSNFKQKILTKVQRSLYPKKIKSSWKERFTWACFKFQPIKNIFRRLKSIKFSLRLVYKIIKNNSHSWLFIEFTQTQKVDPTSLDNLSILTWKVLLIWNQNVFLWTEFLKSFLHIKHLLVLPLQL